MSVVRAIAKVAGQTAKAVARTKTGLEPGQATRQGYYLRADGVRVSMNGQIAGKPAVHANPNGWTPADLGKSTAKNEAARVAAAQASRDALKKNALEVLKGGVALKLAKKSAGIGIGAVAANNEMARARGEKDAPAPFSPAVTQFDRARSYGAVAGVGLAGAGLLGDIMHRIPGAALRKVPVAGPALAAVAPMLTHRVSHGAMYAGAGLSFANFDAAGRHAARLYDRGGLTGKGSGMVKHAFLLGHGLPAAATRPTAFGAPNPLRTVRSRESLSAKKSGGH